jgi:hypothetical protein
MNIYSNPKNTKLQKIAWFFIILMVTEICFPATALALTSGPVQPEYQSFTPAGASEMVNPFTGDFSYNIPLLEVPGPDGGYPINLFYNSVNNPEEEASWTGLGWNVNLGALSRQTRGLPDDFSGVEKIGRKLDMKANETLKVRPTWSVENFGVDPQLFNAKLYYVYNTYKGYGFSSESSLNISSRDAPQNPTPLNISLNANLDFSTIEAANFNASIIGSVDAGKLSLGAGYGIGLNARGGVEHTLIATLGLSLNTKKRVAAGERGGSLGVMAKHTFVKATYTPPVTIPWTGESIGFQLNGAFGAVSTFLKIGIEGMYMNSRIRGGGEWQWKSAYGYDFLQNATAYDLQDFNQEKSGKYHRYNKYLSTPILTPDMYTVSGQGINGNFRSHRSDYGMLNSPNIFSTTTGGSFGAEGGPIIKWGGDASFNIATSSGNEWPKLAAAKYKDELSTNNPLYEASYFKMGGELSPEPSTASDYLGPGTARELPLAFKLNSSTPFASYDVDYSNDGILVGHHDTRNGSYVDRIKLNQTSNHRADRKKRNTSIQPISNKNLNDGNGDEILPEYDVKYYDISQVNNYQNDPTNDIVRTNDNQKAGFTMMGQGGSRWIYGLPVKTHRERSAKFSVAVPNNCNRRVPVPIENNNRNAIDYTITTNDHRSMDYIDEQETPAHINNHLLTTILGANYGDIDGIPGPSDGDVGYWMKTNYVKVTDSYQWRAPFFGANYIEGFENNHMDDMGAFEWGSRDAYLPASVETKTHIAYFKVSKRYDARGAKNYVQNTSDNAGDKFGAYSYKLDEISLYSKAEIAANGGIVSNTPPLKTAHFEYDYSLCTGIDNYAESGATADNINLYGNSTPSVGGKLTLKKVYFTYENNTRGELSPYIFNYNESDSRYNPTYNEGKKIDRWGIYRNEYLQSGYSDCDNINLPYVDQSNKEELDKDVMVWHLAEVQMPSGATMKVQLERDDYAYVQDAKATQMFQIFSLDNFSPIEDVLDYGGNRKIFFELENKIPAATTGPALQKELDKYIDDLPLTYRDNEIHKQLSYKIRINLRNTINPTWEYVPGYAEIEKDNNGEEIHAAPSSNGFYTHAYIVLKPSRVQIASTGERIHPMAMNSFNYLRYNLPDQFLEANLGSSPGQNLLSPGAIGQLALQASQNLDATFRGYLKYAKSQGFSKWLDLEHSYISLNSPDGIKHGGNNRVKTITLEDNWNQTETSTLGVAYEYTTRNESGELISSGVALNEPYAGYEECTLRWADIQEEFRDGRVREVHVYEHPLNEGYYPGAMIGYSKVKVRSLASNYAYEESKGTPIPSDLQNKDFSTTGQTTYEYYTAKDFPIITSKTKLFSRQTPPLLKSLQEAFTFTKTDYYVGTQGYNIILNDMHGKMKGTSTFKQLADGTFEDNPITRVEHKYQTKDISSYNRGQLKEVKTLENEVDVLVADNPNQIVQTEKQLMGVDYEFFAHGQESKNTFFTIGGQANSSSTFPMFFPLVNIYGSFNNQEKVARAVSTNKIITKSGILKEVNAYDGQASITTKNLVYDAQTGAPILTTVNNQLGGEIYNYSVPAHLAHNRMGSAAENWNVEYEGNITPTPDNCTGYYVIEPTGVTGADFSNLKKGDELIGTVLTGGNGKVKVIYMGELWSTSANSYRHQFDFLDVPTMTGTPVMHLRTVRSGNRNILGASIAQYSTIDNDNNPLLSKANPLTDRVTNTQTWKSNLVAVNIVGNQARLNAQVGPQWQPALLNNVLSASAAEFSDEWTLEYYDFCSDYSRGLKNPYVSGERGVWRTNSTYTYIDDRTQNALLNVDQTPTEEIDIRKSGTIDNVPLFDWRNPFTEYMSESKWVRTQDITKYHLGGQTVESRDVLGNYQSSLYGYEDNLVTAVGVNAKHYELGYEGFEEPNEAGLLSTLSANGATNNGHIDIYPWECQGIRQYENYRLTFPMQAPVNNEAFIIVRQPYLQSSGLVNTANSDIKATLHLKNNQNVKTVQSNVVISGIYPLELNGASYEVPGLANIIDEDTKGEFTVYKLSLADCDHKALARSDWWAGQVTLSYLVDVNNNSNNNAANDAVTDVAAHTGKYSLKLDKTNNATTDGKHTYYQQALRLVPNKEYVLSAWIKVENTTSVEPVPTYKVNNGERNIQFLGQTFEPSGPIINGWQRIEGKAVASSQATHPVIIIQDNTPANELFYIDDIRIFPEDGNMISYVYDPADYKLRATLDDNNYATFYIYDQSGSLIATKRETERGIKTIQESRSFVQPTTNY